MSLILIFSFGFWFVLDIVVIVVCDVNYLFYVVVLVLVMVVVGYGYDVLIGGFEFVLMFEVLMQVGIGYVVVCDDVFLDVLLLDVCRLFVIYMELFLGNVLCGYYCCILVIDVDILYECGDLVWFLLIDMLGCVVVVVCDNW